MENHSADDGARSKPTYDEFYKDHRDRLPAWLFRHLEDFGLTEGEAEEVASEVWLTVYASYEKIDYPVAYAYKCARRKANRYLVDKKRECERIARFLHRTAIERGISSSVNKILDTVGENGLSKREVLFLELRYIEGKNLKQIAELWGYTHGYMRHYALRVESKANELLNKPYWEEHTHKKDILQGLLKMG